MRKLKFLIPTILFVMISFNVVNTTFANNAQILVDDLNVRKGPSETSEIINSVNSDEKYSVIQTNDEWIEIQLSDNRSGWVSAEYVSINSKENEDSTSIDSTSITNITIPTDNIHVRSGDSTEDDILFFAKKDMKLKVISESEDWYEIENNDQSGFIQKKFLQKQIPSDSNKLKDKVFVIDAGHGGYDVGAIGVSESYEKDIALYTTKKLERALTNLGANVFLTRNNDEFIRLGSRVSFANIVNPSAFISIHYNSFPDLPNTTGIVSHYYDENDELLAENIQQELIEKTGDQDRGTVYEDLQVLRHNKNQAVLLELGFISQEQQESLLLTKSYQDKLVKGIVSGLTKYYTSHSK